MGDTIDPNDLDSIDALLDEAELESSKSEEPELIEEDTDVPVPEASETADKPVSEEEDLLESIEEVSTEEAASIEAQAVPESKPEPEPEPIRVPDDGEMPPKTEPIEPAKKAVSEPELDPEAILAQRQKKKQNQPTASQPGNNLSVKEMEAVKKLIIIFSSVLIVLGLVTIGLSTWAALSASHGLDEETKQTLEDIKTGTNEVAMKSITMSKDITGLHKKLDALSFQLEQLNGDLQPLLEKMDQGGSTVNQKSVATEPTGHQETTHSVPEATAPVVAKMDPALMKKMREVNANVIKVQKRVAEINRRIKALQTKYNYLLKGMKHLEKSVLESKVKQQKEGKNQAAKTHQEPSEKSKQPPHGIEPLPGYIYQAPDYVY
ncbi:hypothetical protein [Galenea microaerophila]